MSMTKREVIAKNEIRTVLSKEGYPTYASLLSNFEIHLTKDPGVIGYMIPSKGVITLNEGLDLDQVSVVVRHEILHEYFNHAQRFIDHIGQDAYDKRNKFQHNEMNIAGDYDISNRGYTDKDKQTIRSIYLNGQILSGLVTEDEHPDWVNLSVAEMYDKLEELRQKEKEEMKDDLQQDGGEGEEGEGEEGEGGDGYPSNNSKEDNTKSNHKPQIGDTGSEEIQAAEQAERDANDASKEAQDKAEEKKKEGDSEAANAQNEIKKDSDKLAKEAKDVKDDIKEKGKASEKEQARIKAIQDALNDVKNRQKALDEISNAKIKEGELRYRKAQEQKKREIAKQNPRLAQINALKSSIKKFFNNQLGDTRDETWKRYNSRTGHLGILKPGVGEVERRNIPLLSVFIDQSGSFDERDVQVGLQVISTLAGFEKQGLLKIKVYYFANHVHLDAESARAEGGTNAGNEILETIVKTRTDNVVILTDSDLDYNHLEQKVIVRGAVWFLFRNSTSTNIQEHLKGRKGNFVYEIQ